MACLTNTPTNAYIYIYILFNNIKFILKHLKRVSNCNFSQEQSMLPEDDRMIETWRSALSVLMRILHHLMNICAFVGVLVK